MDITRNIPFTSKYDMGDTLYICDNGGINIYKIIGISFEYNLGYSRNSYEEPDFNGRIINVRYTVCNRSSISYLFEVDLSKRVVYTNSNEAKQYYKKMLETNIEAHWSD